MIPNEPSDTDDLVFDDDATGDAAAFVVASPWQVLVVDDEPDVHHVTRLAMTGLTVDGAHIQLHHAHSGAEARAWLQQHPDTAVVLLDVVMESEHAGLDVARWIRETLRNPMVRVILRTGQPGMAPEWRVMSTFDIHDYLAKTELTRTRLHTALTGAVRAYRDMRTIALQRAGLRRVIDATATLFPPSDVEALLGGILQQVSALLLPRESTVFFVARPSENADAARVVAASGRFAGAVGRSVPDVLPAGVREVLDRALADATDVVTDLGCVYVFRFPRGELGALYIDGGGPLGEWERTLVSLYVGNAGLALANARLWTEREELLAAFARFVESAMITLLGRADVRAVSRGDQVAREMTVLFVDIVGFTRRTERSGPAEVFGLLNEVFGTIGPVIARHGGIVDKYLGDGAMVLFPGGSVAAVAAANDLVAALDALNASGRISGPPVDVGVSIHSGAVILGTIGYQGRIDITAVSDAVNTASRMQGWTRALGARVLVSEAVIAGCGAVDPGDLRAFGPLPMRGRASLVPVYQLLAPEPPARRARLASTRDAFAQAIALRERGELLAAAEGFAVIAAADPEDVAAAWFAERCRVEARDGAV